MTVIAWDGRVLAADKLVVTNGCPSRTRKLFNGHRPSDGAQVLVGVTGVWGEGEQYLAYLRGERHNPPALKDIGIIMIDRKRRIWYGGPDLLFCQMDTRRWAIGCGADYAMGAMAAGKTAREAVLITNKLDVNCGLGVDTVAF